VTQRRVSSDGDRERFRVLYERSYGPISSYVKRRVRHDDGSDADVVAEIFIVAWRRLHDVPTHPQELPWLYGVARNLVANHVRKTQRSQALVSRLTVEEMVIGDESVGMSNLELRVEQVMGQFSDLDREIFRLVHWENLSPDDIAVVVGITSKAVERRIARSRARVREAINPTPTEMIGTKPLSNDPIELQTNERNIS